MHFHLWKMHINMHAMYVRQRAQKLLPLNELTNPSAPHGRGGFSKHLRPRPVLCEWDAILLPFLVMMRCAMPPANAPPNGAGGSIQYLTL